MPRAALSQAERQALRRLLESPKLEILPLAGIRSQLTALPTGATLTVTASPAKGLEASIALARQLREDGFEPVMHLAARMVTDRAHLSRLLVTMRESGIARAFVIGGDATKPGDYPDALSLLRDMADAGHGLDEIGIGCYPQGHPQIPDDRLLSALREKAPYAQYMTTQLCFDARALAEWVAARRQEGLVLPVDIGIPGSIETARLLRVGTRIGVRDAARFLAKYGLLVARLLRPGGYRPDRLLQQLAPMFADPDARIRGLHVYTFNQVERTESWRRAFLGSIGPA